MRTPDQITATIAAAFKRSIQAPIYGNIALNDDGTNPSDIPYTVPVKIEQQEETYYAYFSPFIDATKLANNTRVKMIYERDGYLTIIDADDVAARESYPNPPPRSFVLSQHNHSSAEQGGQLNISNAINAGVLAQTYGGTGADLSASSVGSVFYQNAFMQMVALAAVATGNALISGGVGAAPSYGKIGLTTHVSGTLPATNGGTGHAVYAVGDILYASTTTALSRLADVATGNALISGGVGVAPAWGKIGLTTHVSGTLAVGNGGTGAASFTANSVLLGNGTSAFQEVAPGSSGNVLTSNGTTWTSAAPSGGGGGWTDDGAVVRLTTSTDNVSIGTATGAGKLFVAGDADEVQLQIRGNGTQTQNVVIVETSAPATLFSISGAGAVTMNGSVTQDAGAVVFNEAGADHDFRVEGDTDTDLLKIDAGLDMVGISEGTPTALLHIGAGTTARASMRMTVAAAAPTLPNRGDMWDDSAYGFTYRNKDKTQTPRWGGFTQAARVTVSGTSTATTLLGTIYPTNGNVFPANYFQVGSAIRIRASGEHVTSSGTDTPLIRIRFGGLNIISTTLPTLSNVGGVWNFEWLIVCRTAGASGRFTGSMMGFCQTNTGVNDIEIGANNFDTTGSLTLDILIDPSGTTLVWDCDQIDVEAVN